MPKLIIMSPEGDPRTVELTDSQTIGRANECTITIDEPVCSRRQCQILRISSGYEIVDMKSRNGTKINGVKRNRHVLSDGDTIEIGATRITYREREGAEEEVVLEDFGGGGASAAEGDCHLVYAADEKKGEKIPLTGDRVTFGRKDSNTVKLKDPMASSYHCEITREGGGYVLRDLGSTNGTIVNGEPVSETTLSHGARIRIGRTRFVFMDPAVADFEQALAAEEEQETDWGLMRAQVDMGRVKRARRASLVWLLLFVLVVGGGAAVFLTQPDLVKDLFGIEETRMVREIPDNLVDPEDFSFESPNPKFVWQIPEGAPGEFRMGPGPSHQGSASLSLTGPDETGGVAIVRLSREFPVVARNSYEVSAWVKRGSPESLARAGILWRAAIEGGVERFSFTPFAGGDDWTRVSTVAVAPPRAELGQVVLAVAGPGAAFFDDVVFKGATGGPAGVAKEKGGLNLLVAGDGDLAVEKTARFLVWNGGFTGVAADGSPLRQPYVFQADGIAQTDGGARIAGTARAPGAGGIPLAVSVSSVEEGFTVGLKLEETAEGLGEWGLGFAVARTYLSEGATIAGPWGAREVQSDTDQENVEKVILGGPANRISINAEGGARFRMFSTAEGLRFALLGPAGAGERSFEVVMDFSSKRQEAQSILSRARGARSAVRRGEAIQLYSRILNEFPFDEGLKGIAKEERETLETEGKDRLAAARDRYLLAKDFFDESDLGRAGAEAEGIAADFEGYAPIADAAVELRRKVEKTLAGVRERGLRDLAGRLRERAEDFGRRGQNRLAAVFSARADEIEKQLEE